MANTHVLRSELTENAEPKDKRLGMYRHIACGIPVVILYRDLIALSRCGDEQSHYSLAKLLEKYVEGYLFWP